MWWSGCKTRAALLDKEKKASWEYSILHVYPGMLILNKEIKYRENHKIIIQHKSYMENSPPPPALILHALWTWSLYLCSSGSTSNCH